MPNLINVIKDTPSTAGSGQRGDISDQERRAHLQNLLERKDDSVRGMEWGTVLLFSCEKDCCSEQQEGWFEEFVLVQWDD